MKTQVHRLAKLMAEVADFVLVGNWERYNAASGAGFYYVFGHDEMWDDLGSGRNPGSERVAKLAPPTIPRRKYVPRARIERVLRARVAGSQQDYIKKAKERIEKAGITAERQNQILETLFHGDPSPVNDLTADQLLLLAELIDAISGAQADKSDEEETEELQRASELMHFQELSRRYRKLLDRVATLEPLSFDDRQLEEATRCWLYGFNRGAVILAATALEATLKKAIGETALKVKFKGSPMLGSLVEFALKLTPPLLSAETCKPSRLLVKLRNNCVHKGWEPNTNDAAECLAYARKVISEVHSWPQV